MSASHDNDWRCLRKSDSPAWDKLIETLSAEIRTRHYSRKTLKAYADWIRKYQAFLHDKQPEELSATDVKEYLTQLAVNCKVSASTQNQAFNALLFLYRHILKKDFGEHKDIPRAKRSKYIPVVLSMRKMMLFCNASSAGQLRYPDDTDTSGPQRCKDYDDLYALRAKQDDKGSEKPAGFLEPSLHNTASFLAPEPLS